MDKIIGSEFEIKEISEDGVTFEGWANKAVVDDMGDMMKFDRVDMRRYEKNPIILYNHNRDLPIGRALDKKITEQGLWIKAKISNSKDPFVSYVRDLVKEGILKTLSIGFEPKQEQRNSDGVNEIKEWRLNEISVVTLPANIDAEFALTAKALAEKNGVDYQKFLSGELSVKSTDEENTDTPPPAPTTPPPADDPEDKGCNPDKKPKECKPEETPEGKAEGESIQECLSRKIPKLIQEGKPREQAIAIAMQMCSEEGKCNLSSLPKEDLEALFAHAKQVSAPMQQAVPDLEVAYSPMTDLLKSQLAMLGEILNTLRTVSTQLSALAKTEEAGENEDVPPATTTPPPEGSPETETEGDSLQKAVELSNRIKGIVGRLGL